MKETLEPVIDWLTGQQFGYWQSLLAIILVILAIRSPPLVRAYLEHRREWRKIQTDVEVKKKRLEAELERKKVRPPAVTHRRKGK